MNIALILLFPSLALAGACGVSQEAHRKALADLEVAQAELAEAQKPQAEGDKDPSERIAELEEIVARLESEKSELQNELERAKSESSAPAEESTKGDYKEHVREVIKKSQKEIRYCYETELSNNPELAGRVDVKFTIEMSGGVASAMVQNTSLNSSKVESCLLGKIRRMSFQPTANGGLYVINYPFNFSVEQKPNSTP